MERGVERMEMSDGGKKRGEEREREIMRRKKYSTDENKQNKK